METDALIRTAWDWHQSGRAVALAWVIETWGSAPRRAGSLMIITMDGTFAGSVSGGCVESAVITAAEDVLADNRPRVLTFGVSDGDAFAAGLACGGTIRVLVEPVGNWLAPLAQACADAQPQGYRHRLRDATRQMIAPHEDPVRFRSDQSGVSDDVFTAIVNPPLRLLIVGAVHIAQALAPMAQLAGYAPVVIDPRAAFAQPARFLGTSVICDWPDTALDALNPDTRTAIVTLTHDAKIDDAALMRALASPAFYIGSLGSSRTHAARLDRLRQAGWSGPDLARLHGPVGLPIRALTPAEIAVATLAQITATLRNPADDRAA